MLEDISSNCLANFLMSQDYSMNITFTDNHISDPGRGAQTHQKQDGSIQIDMRNYDINLVVEELSHAYQFSNFGNIDNSTDLNLEVEAKVFVAEYYDEVNANRSEEDEIKIDSRYGKKRDWDKIRKYRDDPRNANYYGAATAVRDMGYEKEFAEWENSSRRSNSLKNFDKVKAESGCF